MNQLEQLRQYTTVVADTGNFRELAQFAPRDATTNPSLILKAVLQPDYAPLLADTVAAHRGAPLEAVVDAVLVRFGTEILRVVPGRVSTEVDARLSFDTEATAQRARAIIALYQAAGVPRERVLIKIAATWEGIRAAAQQGVALRFQVALARQLQQPLHRGGIDEVLRQVGKDLGRVEGQRGEAAGVAGEGLAQVEVADLRGDRAARQGAASLACARGPRALAELEHELVAELAAVVHPRQRVPVARVRGVAQEVATTPDLDAHVVGLELAGDQLEQAAQRIHRRKVPTPPGESQHLARFG